jgi:hypothetical protein
VLQLTGISSPEDFKRQMSMLETHLMLKSKVSGASRRLQFRPLPSSAETGWHVLREAIKFRATRKRE